MQLLLHRSLVNLERFGHLLLYKLTGGQKLLMALLDAVLGISRVNRERISNTESIATFRGQFSELDRAALSVLALHLGHGLVIFRRESARIHFLENDHKNVQ